MEKLKLISGLTKRQSNFIKLFATLFNVRDAHGRLKPFIPTDFQQEFLKDSMLCNKQYKNRVVNKGRGIGMTALVAGEILIAARLMPKVKIPVASISARTANVLMSWTIDLADSSNILNITEGIFKIDRDTSIGSICKLKNGSQIIPISGGSPDSIRSLRANILILDEFAFNESQREILTAGERCLSEGGQITIISTPRTADTISDEFWRIYINAEELGYKKYNFPIFDPTKINLHKSLTEQNLTPIASWIDIPQLEKDRKRDLLMFSRENLGMPMDESVAFLSWSLIKKSAILNKLPEILENNPISVGIDVGREQDLTAIDGFQEINGKFYHVVHKSMRGVDIPTQVEEIKQLDDKYDFHNINVDATGIGLGLAEYAKKYIGGKVKKVQFTRESKTKMAVNLRNLMQDERVYLLKDSDFMDRIHSVPYDTLNANRTSEGHADEFWSCALALMKPKGQIRNAGAMLDNYI